MASDLNFVCFLLFAIWFFCGALRSDAVLTLLSRVPTTSPDLNFVCFLLFAIWFFCPVLCVQMRC
jgi:hypothetical protein